MQNHKDLVMADFSFAVKPDNTSETAVSSSNTESNSGSGSQRGGTVVVAPLEVETSQHQQERLTQEQRQRRNIKQSFRKLGGAVNKKLNVAKWIDDLEHDQGLADQLDRVNKENADDQEGHDLCRQARDACVNNVREHLLEFLRDCPGATYEEWIGELHPDNVNPRLDGLTQMPMIDHRFYVADSDHRILWNEYLNDLNDPTNMAPVRQYVEARRSDNNAGMNSNTRREDEEDSNNNLLFGNEGKNGMVDLLS